MSMNIINTSYNTDNVCLDEVDIILYFPLLIYMEYIFYLVRFRFLALLYLLSTIPSTIEHLLAASCSPQKLTVSTVLCLVLLMMQLIC